MKVAVIQQDYSLDFGDSDRLFQESMESFDNCDSSLDIIVFPECCDIPAYPGGLEQFLTACGKYTGLILAKASETARRCNAMVFVNASDKLEGGYRNTTWCFDRSGNVAGKYYKQHPTEDERKRAVSDCSYSLSYNQPRVLEMEGLRFAFLTCYDFYFYEMFSQIARQKVDFIIGCSHQRSDRRSAIDIITRFCAYNCNAYVLRSSVRMPGGTDIGGGSMIVAPDGTVLADLHGDVGMACAEVDPAQKYYKPAGFGNPPSAHWEYLEKGRRPWNYRPAGGAMVPSDGIMSYPRICAHRGFPKIAPENSMASFGAAVAAGANEIEFDIWQTRDGKIVSIHDECLDRVSTGIGKVTEHTYEELLQYDFGIKYSDVFEGLKILLLEEILKRFSCQAIMNIHLKVNSDTEEADEGYLKKLLALLYQYDCHKHCYIMCSNDNVLQAIHRLDPSIILCAGRQKKDPYNIVDRAIKFGYQKVQLFKPFFTREMIDKAHSHGIICNVFYSDEAEETQKYLDMGVDTILTNNYLQTANTLLAWRKRR